MSRHFSQSAAGRLVRRPEFMLGAWLNTFFAAMIIGHSRQPALLFVALVAGAALVVVLTWGRPARHQIGPMTAWGSLVLLGAILAGYAANLDRYDASFVFANVTSMVLALGMAYLVATRLDLDWRLLLACHAVVALLLMPLPIAAGQMVWGRLLPGGLHPNYLGMIAMVAFIGALGMRPRLLRWLVLLVASAVMVAVSSRASMLASGVAALAHAAAGAAGAPPRAPALAGARTVHAALAVLGVGAGALALWLLEADWLMRAADLLLKIDDPYRGVGTGASGRTEAWTAALALWSAQPLLGVGFKGHTFLMPQELPAHSAYLGLLAETGVLGMAGYLTQCGAAVAGLWRQRRDPASRAGIALVASYLVYGLVETRAVGFGNPYSILFLWIALYAPRLPLAEPFRIPRSHASQPGPISRPEGSPP
ncbi:O-antigen ligase family protein [Ramlibacter sp.]|uniref:O-antigen ligase family protein n=1 Tax=Ramlibacter sp. TaxID=1917967 RepID=UPI002CCFD79E|nr:O-antigen ligase family protein [Ramlibacter sp.]HWI80668.1 O-antigen ligase family protein [Ramlibacter sp.]